MLPTGLSTSCSKFRCINHKLPIEKKTTDLQALQNMAEICNLCNSAELGDAYIYDYILNVTS